MCDIPLSFLTGECLADGDELCVLRGTHLSELLTLSRCRDEDVGDLLFLLDFTGDDEEDLEKDDLELLLDFEKVADLLSVPDFNKVLLYDDTSIELADDDLSDSLEHLAMPEVSDFSNILE